MHIKKSHINHHNHVVRSFVWYTHSGQVLLLCTPINISPVPPPPGWDEVGQCGDSTILKIKCPRMIEVHNYCTFQLGCHWAIGK